MNQYIFEDNPERTLNEMLRSKLRGGEISYYYLKYDDFEDSDLPFYERFFSV